MLLNPSADRMQSRTVMDEKDFKKHLKDLAHGHHHPEEHDWASEPAASKAAPKRKSAKPAAKRKAARPAVKKRARSK